MWKKALLLVLNCLLLSLPIYGTQAGYRTTEAQKSSLKHRLQRRIEAHIQNPLQPRPVYAIGLDNAYQVAPNLYRGAQPTEEGYRALANMGIKTVISLRVTPPNTHLLKQLGIKSYHLPINPTFFKGNQTRKFLEIIANTDGPVYIHCLYGSDRTGMMVALYRMIFQNWPREQAIREMTNERFGFHPVFSNLVYYIENVKIEQLSTKNHRLKNLPDERLAATCQAATHGNNLH